MGAQKTDTLRGRAPAEGNDLALQAGGGKDVRQRVSQVHPLTADEHLMLRAQRASGMGRAAAGGQEPAAGGRDAAPGKPRHTTAVAAAERCWKRGADGRDARRECSIAEEATGGERGDAATAAFLRKARRTKWQPKMK